MLSRDVEAKTYLHRFDGVSVGEGFLLCAHHDVGGFNTIYQGGEYVAISGLMSSEGDAGTSRLCFNRATNS